MAELLTIVASLRAKPGREDDLRDALLALVGPTREEDGCVEYHLHQGVEDPALFTFYETWTSADLLETHLASRHVAEFGALAGDLTEAPADIQRLRRVS